jgi:glycosyltransferase involved in cell wall biosynthesis
MESAVAKKWIAHDHRKIQPHSRAKPIGHYLFVIAISLVTLAPGQMGGSERYARSLIRALDQVGTREYLVVTAPDARDAGSSRHSATSGAGGAAPRPWAILRAAASAGRFDRSTVVHYPLTVPLPRARGRRVAVTLHDVLHHDHPELVSPAVRLFRAAAYDRASRNADLVIVPSDFVKRQAIARLGVEPERIRVIAHGVDHEIFHPVEREREPFLLYPARAWPHKNHARLFEAFVRVRRVRPDLTLVLTGGGHERLQLPDGVRSLGSVSDKELARLYQTAEAMVFPSLYEGFGMPLLEAMACACPVAASDVAPLAALAADATVIFDPTTAACIEDGILRVLHDAESLGALGVSHSRRFTWEATARDHEMAYAELENGSPLAHH